MNVLLQSKYLAAAAVAATAAAAAVVVVVVVKSLSLLVFKLVLNIIVRVGIESISAFWHFRNCCLSFFLARWEKSSCHITVEKC